jgi:hypothetical protein
VRELSALVERRLLEWQRETGRLLAASPFPMAGADEAGPQQS